MKFIRVVKLFRRSNKSDSFYWLVCLLVFLAGIVFETCFKISMVLSLFISKTNMAELFTVISGVSSLGALIFAFYVFINWRSIKLKHYQDDLFEKIKEKVCAYYYDNFIVYSDEDQDVIQSIADREIISSLFTYIALLSVYIDSESSKKLNEIVFEKIAKYEGKPRETEDLNTTLKKLAHLRNAYQTKNY